MKTLETFLSSYTHTHEFCECGYSVFLSKDGQSGRTDTDYEPVQSMRIERREKYGRSSIGSSPLLLLLLENLRLASQGFLFRLRHIWCLVSKFKKTIYYERHNHKQRKNICLSGRKSIQKEGIKTKRSTKTSRITKWTIHFSRRRIIRNKTKLKWKLVSKRKIV